MSEHIVRNIARMIDEEGAFGRYYSSTNSDEPMPFTVRQQYFQSKYECKARDIIALLLGFNHDNLRNQLIEYEKECWTTYYKKYLAKGNEKNENLNEWMLHSIEKRYSKPGHSTVDFSVDETVPI